MSDANGAFARILEIAVTADESADTLTVTAVNYYATRQKLDSSDPFSVPFSGGAEAGTTELELGTQHLAPNVIRLVSTFQA